MEDVKRLTHTYLGLVVKVAIMAAVFAALFLFTNLTTEFYDTPKFLVLLIVTGVLLVLFALKSTVDNKVTFVRTALDIPLLLLLAVGIVSTFVSPAPYVAILGNQLKIHTSLTSLILYVLFYFMLVNLLKGAKEIKGIFFITTLAAGALAAITLLAYFGVKLLPAPWVHGINFTPTGSSFSTAAVLTLLIPIVASQLIAAANLIPALLNCALLTLFLVTIALTGGVATWVAALVGLVLSAWSNGLTNTNNLLSLKPVKLITLSTPLVVLILAVFLSLVPPLGGAKNPLYTQFKAFPKETSLGFVSSWKIAISTFRDNPIWGSGPGTFLFDFTNYKPIEFNQGKNWNLRFDSAFNEYLQILATLGGVGLIALLSLTALFISSAYPFKSPLAISGIVFFILLVLHPSSLVLWVLGILILASFSKLNLSFDRTSSWNSLTNITHSLVTSSEETLRIEALPSIILTVVIGLILFSFFFGGKFALADFHHRTALNAISQNNGLLAYNELVASEKLNPIADLYRIDLAQTNFALANAIAQAKAPTEASPTGTLTDQDKQNIQVLLQQSINEGRSATTLNPRSAQNWEVLALLYRQIAGVAQNALVFSLDSYGKAIFQDPLNPNLRLSVGGVYYATANYDLAIRFFTDAINLKPDFANGYYNLSVALKDKGDLANAQAVAEKVLTLVEKDSADYKIAQDYLNSIKPPAAETTGALKEEGLPKVVDVGNPPEKIATPPAIKKPNSTPEPSQ